MKPNRRNWLKQLSLSVAGLGLSNINLFAARVTDDMSSGSSHKKESASVESSESPAPPAPPAPPTPSVANNLKLGAFSISLNVKDINVSKTFYEALGFKVFAGDIKKNYLIMKNENALIGIFQGMFQNNILTFNPGWDENAKLVKPFEDVRKIQQALKQKGIKPTAEVDEHGSGPAGFFLTDPDGNAILIDQHVS